ncbi:hypothetical protein ZIOFF_022577 [Zingiber officinale]|uniref:Uncharacterized protein n=1 Tax=Zingiber officinale TaxID=94328 RepID=A0A8J5H342_ZINOF|nr:hypothetical protein ZIOFF_022577 [Zingiber officinale]
MVRGKTQMRRIENLASRQIGKLLKEADKEIGHHKMIASLSKSADGSHFLTGSSDKFAKGNPIVGVHIFLYSADAVGMHCPQGPGNGPGQGTTLCHVISDAEGKFVFKYLPSGNFIALTVFRLITKPLLKFLLLHSTKYFNSMSSDPSTPKSLLLPLMENG